MVDGYKSKLVNVVSGVPQGSVLDLLLLLLYTSEIFSNLENKLIGYADKKQRKEKIFLIQIKIIWYYNVYKLKVKFSINYSD